MLSAVLVTGSSEAFQFNGAKRTFQAYGATTAGAGAATIIIEGCNVVAGGYITLGTITLTLSSSISTDGFASDSSWEHVRARVSAISGTNAYVTVTAGVEI